MWCSQCKTDKPKEQFFPINKPGWKVTKCNACVRENMRRYWRYVEMDPDKVRRGGAGE